jgi:KUP system potassium uptake protein
VIEFGSSGPLAAAYGVAVTATMLITTLLFFAAELAFFGANLAKLLHGGWIPLALGALLSTLMVTWKQGQKAILNRMRPPEAAFGIPIGEDVRAVERDPPPRIPHPAVCLVRYQGLVPPVLLLSREYNGALHEPLILLTVETAEVPRVPAAARAWVEALGAGFFRVVLVWGFMEEPDVPAGLAGLSVGGTTLDPGTIGYVLGRDVVVSTPAASGMSHRRERLSSSMRRNEGRATLYFRIPPARAVEIGVQIEI